MTPGMPVEAFIETGERTMMSYLIKPLHDQLMRAFREKQPSFSRRANGAGRHLRNNRADEAPPAGCGAIKWRASWGR